MPRKPAKKPENRTRLLEEDLALYPLEGGRYILIELPQTLKVCVVCGAKTRLATMQSCSDTWCKVAVALEPRIRDPRRINKSSDWTSEEFRKRWVSKYPKRIIEHTQASQEAQRRPLTPWGRSVLEASESLVTLDFDEASWFVDNEWLGRDRRGEGDKRHSVIWSRTSKVACAFKAIGGWPAITLRRAPGLSIRATIVRDMMGGEDSSYAYDVFFAWRCGCQVDSEVVYKTLDDLPSEAGYHGACPRCGQAPLEILAAPRGHYQTSLLGRGKRC